MKNRTFNFGLLLVCAIPAIAVLLWLLAPKVTEPPYSFIDILTTIGKLLGILGTALFAITLILSARFHFLENLFYGLNKVYERHSQIGQVALIFLLFHPVMLLGIYSSLNFRSAIRFFIPSTNWAQNWGIFSLALAVLLVTLTLYIRPKYNLWKWTHKFLGLAFFMGALHVYLIPSDVSRFLPLRIYMLTISGIAIYSFLYRTVFGSYTTKKYKYMVSGTRILTKNIIEVSLVPKEERIIFNPGQFVFISFLDKEIGNESHPFSITSSGDDRVLTVTIKNLGDYTENLNKLSIDSMALIEGPFGKFSFKESIYKKQIWIAGGIGITPFLSMARSLKKNKGYSIELFYCVKNKNELAYFDELSKLKNFGLNIIPYYSDGENRITADIIKEISGSILDKAIFICSPPNMIKSLREQFLNRGVRKWSIYSEEFSL